ARTSPSRSPKPSRSVVACGFAVVPVSAGGRSPPEQPASAQAASAHAPSRASVRVVRLVLDVTGHILTVIGRPVEETRRDEAHNGGGRGGRPARSGRTPAGGAASAGAVSAPAGPARPWRRPRSPRRSRRASRPGGARGACRPAPPPARRPRRGTPRGRGAVP